MKFNFKIQSYQTDAVDSIIRVFAGQPKDDKDCEYTRNADIILSDGQLMRNINKVQARQNIHLSTKLSCDMGRCALDVEMETGTGKTYVYIKTMFELNKQYGWSKFIVVVPSIAIREGVKKSMEMTVEHFMEHYGKKARFFIYNGKELSALDKFSNDPGINIMIINTQAFATSMKEGAKNRESRIIYSMRDDFNSRRPIDVIKASRPIVILDEPQKMGGAATQTGIRNFNPLFTINYSATHKNHHNEVYVLDALDAYNKKLVKKIQVKGFEVHNLRGTDRYMFLEKIMISSNKPPMARLEIEVRQANGIVRKTKTFEVGNSLFLASNGLQQYKDGYTINNIDPVSATIEFVNGKVMHTGEVVGDISEKDMRRIQIRETIQSHFEKEETLFRQGIKTLSLFFIDEVSKYRLYNDDGEELIGEYGRIFEEEYNIILKEYLQLFGADGRSGEEDEYQKYLRKFDTRNIHKGYFSIDKKGHSINSEIKRGSDISDDISAYDLILKNKERLLSFDEPTRFIFSHSALREGWDNPNIFQICTLKHSDNAIAKRQEVGRGLRLAVNGSGTRMDAQTIGEDLVHEINKLTVVASESYATFVSDLQREICDVLYDRPTKTSIFPYLSDNGYIDADGSHILDSMIENGHKTMVQKNSLNENFKKKEFQELWKRINHKYAYTVNFDSEELIKKSFEAINKELHVSQIRYNITSGQQEDTITQSQLQNGSTFEKVTSHSQNLRNAHACTSPYDLIGDIAKGALLTRRTAGKILSKLTAEKKMMFAINPEEFITKVINIIKSQKAIMIVEHISYNQIEGEYDSAIFTSEKHSTGFDRAIRAKRHITDYVFTDGTAGQSIEKTFCERLETADEVEVYAKLPKSFHIPTPVGNYSPDWAIAFKKDVAKNRFYLIETKGSMNSIQYREIEQAKINCASKLFNEISTENVRYYNVDSYDELLNIIQDTNLQSHDI